MKGIKMEKEMWKVPLLINCMIVHVINSWAMYKKKLLQL